MPWNDDYHPNVPIVYPISVGSAKSSGRTHPLEMLCQYENSTADYIVKLWGSINTGFGNHCLAREVYGSLLADFFGLHTPDIAIVQIEDDFPLSQPNPEIQSRLINSIGPNFGSKFIRGATIFNNPVLPGKNPEAIKVFCFDMLIANVDRRSQKPNVFQTPDGFIIFDHEQAFPFSMPQTLLGGCPSGWDFIKEDWVRNHAFFPSLKGKNCALEIEEFIGILDMLNDAVFAKIEAEIPKDWCTPDLLILRNYLLNTRDNSQLFKRSLQEILS